MHQTMGIRSFTTVLGTLALSNYSIINVNARQLHNNGSPHNHHQRTSHHRSSGWVWVPYGSSPPYYGGNSRPARPSSSSSSSSSSSYDWDDDGWDDDGWDDDGWDDDGHSHDDDHDHVVTEPGWTDDGWNDDHDHVDTILPVEPWTDDATILPAEPWTDDAWTDDASTIPVEEWSDDGHGDIVPGEPWADDVSTMPVEELNDDGNGSSSVDSPIITTIPPPPPIAIPAVFQGDGQVELPKPIVMVEPEEDDDDDDDDYTEEEDDDDDDYEEEEDEGEEAEVVEEEEEEEEYYPPPPPKKIVGSVRSTEEAGENPSGGIPLGGILGIVVAATVLAIGLVLFAKKRRSASSYDDEIDPEADDLMLEEDRFIGDPNDPEADIPPPPPPPMEDDLLMEEANDDAIEVDPSVFNLPRESYDPESQVPKEGGADVSDDMEEVISVASDDLESI